MTLHCIQACGSPHEEKSAQIQPYLDDKTLKAMKMEEVKDIERLTTEKDTEVWSLYNELEVRNISMYKFFYTQIHGNFKL
jgi:hypothetical protein